MFCFVFFSYQWELQIKSSNSGRLCWKSGSSLKTVAMSRWCLCNWTITAEMITGGHVGFLHAEVLPDVYRRMGESFIENKSGFVLPAWSICQLIKWQQIEKTNAVFTWYNMETLHNNHRYYWVNWWKWTAIILDIEGIKMILLHFIIITVKEW